MKDMYNEYLKAQIDKTVLKDSNPLSEKMFRRVWHHVKKMDGIHVRRKANTTTKCETCDEIHPSMVDLKTTKSELERLREQRMSHMREIMSLRNCYLNDVERSMRDYRFQTIAFDGTNSNTCKCPLSWRSQLRDEQPEGTYVAQKIQSVLIHGKALVFYPIPPYVQKGMNLTVSTILDALQYVDPRTEAVRFQFDGELF